MSNSVDATALVQELSNQLATANMQLAVARAENAGLRRQIMELKEPKKDPATPFEIKEVPEVK